MSGPPTDIPASELWARLATAKRPTELVDFPRADPETGKPIGKIAMRPLLQTEVTAAKAEAVKKTREVLKDKLQSGEYVAGYDRVLEDYSMVEILFRACMRAENPNLPSFPTSADVRKACTSDECAVLITLYEMVQTKLGPLVAYMDDGECERWIARLKEGASAYPLAPLSSEQKNALIMYLVRHYVSSPTDSFSAGSQPEDYTESP